jgi:hypothetical protein
VCAPESSNRFAASGQAGLPRDALWDLGCSESCRWPRARPPGAVLLDAIGPLLAYDRENDTDLASTLRAFLEQNQNSARTAKLLYIHYNTLRYRLDRAREILGDFLENPQQRLEIELALQLYPLIQRAAAK